MIILKQRTFNATTADPKSIRITLTPPTDGIIQIRVQVFRYNSRFQLKERSYTYGEIEELERFIRHEADTYYQQVVTRWIDSSINAANQEAG